MSKERIPKKFTLMAGHVLFFKDKGRYIEKRYDSLRKEMITRGFQPTHATIDTTVWPPEFYNDWAPTEADLSIIRARINSKINMKPHWYRYRGEYILKGK
jgi:deoxyribonuclease (pyrimidine dimer)